MNFPTLSVLNYSFAISMTMIAIDNLYW